MQDETCARDAVHEVIITVIVVQAQQKYLEAVEKFGQLKDDVDALLAQRDEAYLELLAVPDAGASSGTLSDKT